MCEGNGSKMTSSLRSQAEQAAKDFVESMKGEAPSAAARCDSGYVGASARRNIIEPAQVPDRMIARSVLVSQHTLRRR